MLPITAATPISTSAHPSRGRRAIPIRAIPAVGRRSGRAGCSRSRLVLTCGGCLGGGGSTGDDVCEGVSKDGVGTIEHCGAAPGDEPVRADQGDAGFGQAVVGQELPSRFVQVTAELVDPYWETGSRGGGSRCWTQSAPSGPATMVNSLVNRSMVDIRALSRSTQTCGARSLGRPVGALGSSIGLVGRTGSRRSWPGRRHVPRRGRCRCGGLGAAAGLFAG